MFWARAGLDFEDAVPAIEMLVTFEELQKAAAELSQNPDAFVKRLLAAGGPAGKKIALAKLRPLLTPLLEKAGLDWEDAKPAIELVATVRRLQKALADPELFVRDLLAATGPAAMKIILAKVRKTPSWPRSWANCSPF
jgi:hypothetical protein